MVITAGMGIKGEHIPQVSYASIVIRSNPEGDKKVIF
jgi:hypothetical protein